MSSKQNRLLRIFQEREGIIEARQIAKKSKSQIKEEERLLRGIQKAEIRKAKQKEAEEKRIATALKRQKGEVLELHYKNDYHGKSVLPVANGSKKRINSIIKLSKRF